MNTANDLLRRALEALHFDLSAKESAKVAEDIRAFLAAEPEAEPVRYMVVNEQGETSFLYTRPEPARKPMTEEEWMKIHDEWMASGYALNTRDFVRAIEKHHGIGGDDGEHK